MNGRNHVLVGACGWLLGVPLAAPHLGSPLSAREVVAGTLLCGGAALLPDTDHPRATIARTLGPVTKAITTAIGKVSGGHRNATHSLLGAALFGLGAFGLVHWQWGVLVMFWLCGAWALRLLGPDHLQSADVLAAVVAGAAAWVVSTNVPAAPWMVVAVIAGCLLHLVGDLVTKGTIPLLWPIRKRWGLGLLRTGSKAEEVLSVALTVGVVILGWQAVSPSPLVGIGSGR